MFEDNFFDITFGVDKQIKVAKDSLSKEISLEQFNNQLKIKSSFDLEN